MALVTLLLLRGPGAQGPCHENPVLLSKDPDMYHAPEANLDAYNQVVI